MEIFEFVSKLSQEEDADSSSSSHAKSSMSSNGVAKDGKANKSLTDPLTYLSTVTVYGLIRGASLILSTILHLTSLLVNSVGGLGLMGNLTRESVTVYDFNTMDSFDYSVVANTIQNVPEQSFKIFNIHDDECKKRAMCEAGELLGKWFPLVSAWVREIAENLNFKDIYSRSVLTGLGRFECKTGCSKSPYKKLTKLYAMLMQLVD